MNGDLGAFVRAAQAGDEDAFRVLYRTLQPGLLRYLTSMVGSDAEDVASEAWLQIARDLPSFDGREFRAWTVTIARNRALDHLRRQRRRPTVPMPLHAFGDLPAPADTAEGASERIGTDSAIAMIATLPQREAEAVLLRAVIGLDAESAARVLGRRAGAVRTAAHRGLRRLAELLRSGEYGAGRRATPPAPRTRAAATGPTPVRARRGTGGG